MKKKHKIAANKLRQSKCYKHFFVMEYETTDLHPVYKSGLLIKEDEKNEFEIYFDRTKLNEVWGTIITPKELKLSLKNGWIICL